MFSSSCTPGGKQKSEWVRETEAQTGPILSKDTKLPEHLVGSNRPHVTKVGQRVPWPQTPGALNRDPRLLVINESSGCLKINDSRLVGDRPARDGGVEEELTPSLATRWGVKRAGSAPPPLPASAPSSLPWSLRKGG